MSTISPLSSSVVSVYPMLKVQPQDDVPTVVDPSPLLPAVPSSGSLQSMQTPLASTLTWKLKSSDPITSLMTVNYGSKSIASRFDGLGAAALQRFSTDPSNFSQAVSLSDAAPGGISYQVTLSVKMADGIDVKVNLDSTGASLALQVNSSSKLSATDRATLAKLSNAFQSAIDGISDLSKLDFSGLVQFDPALVSSIDVQANTQLAGTPLQTQTFHAGHTKRSFTSDGPDGSVKVNVDLRQLAAIGNAQQRKAGVDAYLKQFDEAGARGHANSSTLATFKAAFQQMTGVTAATTFAHASPISLTETDHALVTGLPDFDASIKDTPNASNPMRKDEVDTFSYEVSQETTVGGRNQRNRAISQQQHAHLEASFHEPISSAPLALDNSRESQNYIYEHVSEDRTKHTQIGYQNGVMSGAATTEHISRSTQVLKYVLGILTEESNRPEVSDTFVDLLKQNHPN